MAFANHVQLLILFTSLCWISGFSTTVALTMSNMLHNDTYACANTVVTFTCETVGATVLVWSSDELIGTGGIELTFAAGANNPGTRRNSSINDGTYAVLLESDRVEGQTRLISTLFVNATLDVPRASVRCHDQVADEPITASFTVVDLPDVPRDIFGVHLRHFSDSNTTCLISSFWRAPDNSPLSGAMNYMVNVGGNLSAIETLNISSGVEGPRLGYFSLSNCSSIDISVGAINFCGMGSMSTKITLDPISCEDVSACSMFFSSSPPLMSSLNMIVGLTAYVTLLMF